MPTSIITLEDLLQVKEDLLNEIKNLKKQSFNAEKKWYKNAELAKLLGISQSSLQNLRNNGTLPFTKMSGTIYYDINDIDKILKENKVSL